MSQEYDEDSHMVSSPDDSDNEHGGAAVPSPPDSTHQSEARATVLSGGSPIANSNGKRPLNTISNGKDDTEEFAAMANSKARQDHPTKTHEASGYTWKRAEDEPGYSWTNKKALDEHHRALENVVHQEYAVKNKYGDPLALAAREKTMMNSMKT